MAKHVGRGFSPSFLLFRGGRKIYDCRGGRGRRLLGSAQNMDLKFESPFSLSLSLSASLLPLLRSKQSHQMMINFGKIISFFCKASDIFFQQPRMTTTSHRYVAFLRVGHSRPLFIYFRLFKRVDSKKVKKYSI